MTPIVSASLIVLGKSSYSNTGSLGSVGWSCLDAESSWCLKHLITVNYV